MPTAPDAVLVIAFGGPQRLEDVRPFLRRVLRDRAVPPERVDEVARHYEHFGGVSPLTDLTCRQAAGLRDRLERAGPPLPVFVGMRNWHPFLGETLAEMARSGVRRAIGFIAAAHRSYPSCGQYRESVLEARQENASRGLRDVDVVYVDDWHLGEGFIDASARRVEAALDRLPLDPRERARLVFTAHSIPISMAKASRYREQLHESALAVAERTGRRDWALVYQSRSGRPEDPWLGPDICEYLRAEGARGLRAVVVAPIGFLCDHIEVLYDLDHDAAAASRDAGITMVRAETVNDDPRLLDLMADMVRRTYERHSRRTMLPVVAPPA